jgi:hypothetical protein
MPTQKSSKFQDRFAKAKSEPTINLKTATQAVLAKAMQLIEVEGADMGAGKNCPSMFAPVNVKAKDLAIWKEAHQLAANYLRKGAEL